MKNYIQCDNGNQSVCLRSNKPYQIVANNVFLLKKRDNCKNSPHQLTVESLW